MIPKVIHYCWFGRNPKTKSIKKCINTWKKNLPNYDIIEWNEDNFPIDKNLYCKQAYEAKKWAFLTDYARLWIVYNYGGIYLDTDVEVIKSWDNLLEHECFIGRQPGFQVNTGAGFGACKGHPLIKVMMDDYEGISFIKENGEMDLWTCPHRNSQWLFEHGMKHEDSFQEIADAVIYPTEYFSPLDAYSRRLKVTKNTYSIHHCDATWKPSETKMNKMKRYWVCKIKRDVDCFLHLPNLIVKNILGEKRYEGFKIKMKGWIRK